MEGLTTIATCTKCVHVDSSRRRTLEIFNTSFSLTVLWNMPKLMFALPFFSQLDSEEDRVQVACRCGRALFAITAVCLEPTIPQSTCIMWSLAAPIYSKIVESPAFAAFKFDNTLQKFTICVYFVLRSISVVLPYPNRYSRRDGKYLRCRSCCCQEHVPHLLFWSTPQMCVFRDASMA